MDETAITMASELSPAELSYMAQFLSSKQLKGKHIEIGTAAGGTLCKMLECYSNEQRPEFVVVDPMQYFPDQFQIVQTNLANNNLSTDKIDFRITTSTEAFQQSVKSGDTFDFVFIDGVHKIRYVIDDLKWSRLLNIGGYLLMHDYCDLHPGVQMAANRFMKLNPNYEIVTQVESLLVLQKVAASPQEEISWMDTAYAEIVSPFLQLKRSLGKRF